MKRWLLLLILLIPSRLLAQPACTINVPSPTPANVQTALLAAPDGFVMCLGATTGMGGTGHVPANMSDWNNYVFAAGGVDPGTKAGEIRGAGAFNSTCLQADNSTPAAYLTGGCGSAQQTKLYMDNGVVGIYWGHTTSTNNITISNIYFYTDANSSVPSAGDFQAGAGSGANVPFIVHHNDFVAVGCFGGFNTSINTNSGIYYRNRFITTPTCLAAPQAIQHTDGGNGNATWASASTFGTADTGGTHNIYVEQNYFYDYIAVNDLHDGGAREVWRFNEMHNAQIQSHGIDSAPFGGGRGIEYYNNVNYCDDNFGGSGPALNAYVTLRTGTGFAFDNTFPPFLTSKCALNTTPPPIILNQPGISECNSGAVGWPGLSPTHDAVHNSYPFPHQVGWGWDSNSATNPQIGTSPAFAGPNIYQTDFPGTGSDAYPTDGVQQSLEPFYFMNNTNNTGNLPVADVKGAEAGGFPTNCRGMGYSAASTANQTTTVVPGTTPAGFPIPYANVGEQAVIAFADNIGGTTPTVTVKVHGSTSCGSITTLTAGTTGSLRLSAWTCTITADGPQTITVTHDSSAAARAGAVVFLRGITGIDKNPAVATPTTSPYGATVTGTMTTSNEVVIGYYALPVPSTDNLLPGTSDNLTMACATQCVNSQVGQYVGVNGTTGGSPVTVATTYRVVSATTSISVQERDLTQNVTSLAGAVSFTVASPGTANFATQSTPLDNQDNQYVAYNREVYDDYGPGCGGCTAFNGTVGTGAGARGSRPGTCTIGVGWWSTDQGSWNTTGFNSGQSGILDKCTSTNTWTNAFYTPYVMPHGLDTVGGGDILKFTTQPSNTNSNATMSNHPVVTVYLPDGVTVDTGSTASITLSPSGCSYTFTGGSTVTQSAVAGVSPGFANLVPVGDATACTITASATGISGGTSTTFNVTCVPSKVVFTAQPSSAAVGANLGTVNLGVQNSSSTSCVLATNAVTLAAHAGATWASLTSSSSLTKSAVAGTASWTDLSVTPTSGTGSIDATASGLTTATSNSITISGGCTPSKLVFTSQPSNGVLGGTLGPVSVAVQDSGGNTCNDTSTVTLSKHAGTCTGMTLNPIFTGAAVAGVFTTTTINLTAGAGSCQLDAADGGLTGATSNVFTITAQANNAARLRIKLRK